MLNKHYDLRKEERKRKQRLKTFEKLFDGYGDPDATLSETELAALMNDDGMIDPVALNELIAKSEKEQTPSHDRSSNDSDTEGERDEGQLGITDFSEGPNAVWQPAVIPVLAGVAVGKWIPGRLTHELEALAPPSEDSPWPNQSRAAKGMAAYALYVCLVSVNFALLGLLPA